MGNNKAKISIIIPVYNTGKYLNRCINSLINQTLKEIEIIIVNDGSTDNSDEIIRSYNDDRIKYLQIENSGVSVCRNEGLKHATGRYIGYVDSDDWIDENFYEKLYTSCEKHGADIGVAGIVRLSKSKKSKFIEYKTEKITTDLETKLELCDIPDKCYIWNKIYNREKLENLGIKFEEGRIYEDMPYSCEVVTKLEKLITVPDTFYYYWRHNGSLVKSKTAKAKKDFIYMENKAIEFLEQQNIDVHHLKTYTARYKIFGITVYKIKYKKAKREYLLFNFIKWHN